MANVTKPKTRKKIKDSLLNQLIDMGADADHFKDLIDDYMDFFDIKNSLVSDIKKRGVTVEWQNSSTQKGRKKNDSVSELVKVNAQMLKILQQLGITTEDVPITTGDDDDDEAF